MKKLTLLATILGLILSLGCEPTPAEDIVVERLPPVEPNLPAVPTIPPPPHPTQLPDGSYTIYGLRSRMTQMLNESVEVTGYIVDVYVPPECEPGDRDCTRGAPYVWIADTAGESERDKEMMVVGYAQNQTEVDEAMELAARNRYEPPDPESGLLPIPTDFLVGAKIKVTGQFLNISSNGTNASAGLLDYRGHTTLEAATPTE